MDIQVIIAIVQTCISMCSLIISLVTLNKVSNINKENNKDNHQFAIGRNKQKIVYKE